MSSITVVTGSNQGLGFEAVRKLARQANGHTIMTSRNATRGQEALGKVQNEFPEASVEVMELDLDSDASQEAFVKAIEEKHGKVSCLVNNAGVGYAPTSDVPVKDQTSQTFSTNVFQTIKFTDRMLPLLNKDANPRIVVLASTLSQTAFASLSSEAQKRITTEDLTTTDVLAFAKDYVKAVAEDKAKQEGFAENAEATSYMMSKLCDVQFARTYAREHPNIIVNSCCPGWCVTAMGQKAGNPPRSSEEGAEVMAFLATADLDGTSGEFWYDNKVLPAFTVSA
ncbi:Carbonyl reductase NADPH 1 [Hondaea fermentalgiana]|uniref:Carbonyl reductase NADPH 1 n=1 Tax=Hondaea fermentalgiana TaxID=2315210 RepID=A0A2R5GCJ2_9STRA|nr:Carbonyl reductase NADPH 1 [Hondaea fermentalgiana]|eukprot:GBG27428.1 Carbonyl reductase NADPH 1 [Hondaea fermentalgiana]